MIYFIQSGVSGPIKIGYTTVNITHRITALQTGSWEELKLLGTAIGGIDFEYELHQKFDAYRIRGEWFWPVMQLTTYINNLLHLPPAITKTHSYPDTPLPKYDEHKRNYILQLLEKTKNNKLATAKLLNISRSTLYAKLEKYGIRKKCIVHRNQCTEFIHSV